MQSTETAASDMANWLLPLQGNCWRGSQSDLMTVKGTTGIEPGTCSSTGVHDASWVLSLRRRWLGWVVNPNLLKVGKGVHLDTLQS